MTTPVDDNYPEQWKPRERIERDEAAGIAAGINPTAMEKHLAALDERELALLLQRVRAMR